MSNGVSHLWQLNPHDSERAIMEDSGIGNKIDEKDVRIDMSTPGRILNGVECYSMKLTHLPTGTSVSGRNRSTHRLRRGLMRELQQEAFPTFEIYIGDQRIEVSIEKTDSVSIIENKINDSIRKLSIIQDAAVKVSVDSGIVDMQQKHGNRN